jgi:hypothetical protein
MPVKRIQANIQIYLFIKDPVFPWNLENDQQMLVTVLFM